MTAQTLLAAALLACTEAMPDMHVTTAKLGRAEKTFIFCQHDISPATGAAERAQRAGPSLQCSSARGLVTVRMTPARTPRVGCLSLKFLFLAQASSPITSGRRSAGNAPGCLVHDGCAWDDTHTDFHVNVRGHITINKLFLRVPPFRKGASMPTWSAPSS